MKKSLSISEQYYIDHKHLIFNTRLSLQFQRNDNDKIMFTNAMQSTVQYAVYTVYINMQSTVQYAVYTVYINMQSTVQYAVYTVYINMQYIRCT